MQTPLAILGIVCGLHTASAYLPCVVRVLDQQEEIQSAIAVWRSGLSHSRVLVGQLGPPLKLKVVPGVVLSLRDYAGNLEPGLRYEGSSRGPTHEMLEQQRRDQWFNQVME
jgi:hypothetical protein